MERRMSDNPEVAAGEAGAGTQAVESEVREALRQVVDPEIRIDVVALGLIRNVVVMDDAVEVQMILTTPFCPYGGILVQQVKDVTRSVVSGEVRVTLLDEMWSPDLMEGANLAEWGLL
jgi:metal-sulfur cluster biosynthetic enzyme